MKFGTVVPQLNTHRTTSRIFDMTSCFQDGGHDVISAADTDASVLYSAGSLASVAVYSAALPWRDMALCAL